MTRANLRVYLTWAPSLSDHTVPILAWDEHSAALFGSVAHGCSSQDVVVVLVSERTVAELRADALARR